MFWIAAAVIGALIVNKFWEDILGWASTTLANVVGEVLGPLARDLLLDVLERADRVVVGARRAVSQLWRSVKATVLQAAISLEKVTNSRFLKRLTAYLAKDLSGEKRFVRVVQEEEVAWDDLPENVRGEFIRNRSVSAANLELPNTLPARLSH